MSTHAGFAVVASARQGSINTVLATIFSEIGPFFFPLPQTVNVGGVIVSFGGIAQIAAPVLEFHPNPLNAVRGNFAFFSTFNAKVGNGPAYRWRVRLDVAADVAISLGPVNGKIILQANTASITIQPLKVTFLQGPPPPAAVTDALQSAEFAAVATAAVRRLPPFTLATLAPAEFSRTQPATFKDSDYSVFDWFSFTLLVSNTVVRIFEDAVTIAANFSQITNGDANALVDLTRTHGGGSIYVERITDDTDVEDPKFPIIPVETSYTAGTSLATSFNIAVVTHIFGVISPQVAHTPISKQAELRWINGGYSRFEKPFRGNEDGLVINIGVLVMGAIDAIVTVNLQPCLRIYDRSANIGTEGWTLFVARVDVAIPWQVEFVLGIAQALAVAVGMIITLPVAILGHKALPLVTETFDDINKAFAQGDTENIAAAQKLTIQNSAYDAKLPGARYISVTADAIDIGFGTGASAPFSLPQDPSDGASISPDVWSVYDRRPIKTAVTLTPQWATLVRNKLQAVWEVRRKDTNAVVVTGSAPYLSVLGNGVSIPHHSQALYLVSEYVVRCTLTMTLGNQTGEIWAGVQSIKIPDEIDRSHPYVEWGPKFVYFSNPGTAKQGVPDTWVRLSRSRIHRTAVAARCLMLKRAASDRVAATERERTTGHYISKHPKFRYKDFLPFSRETLSEHRKELCEYCFFGGPEKQVPFPAEDWFEPNQKVAKEKLYPQFLP